VAQVKKLLILFLLLPVVCYATDKVLGKLSSITWVANGSDKVAVWGGSTTKYVGGSYDGFAFIMRSNNALQ